MLVHQLILALQRKMTNALVRMNLHFFWKIFLHRKWDLNRLVSKVWYGKWKQQGFGILNVSPWLNYKMHWNTYDETNVPIRTVLLPNALSMGASSCMSIYFVYLIWCWWMVTLRKMEANNFFNDTKNRWSYQSWELATIGNFEYHIQNFYSYGLQAC